VPAALVGTVAVTVTVHAAPVPRESPRVQVAAVPVLDWVVPLRVTADRVAPAVVTLSAPPETAEVTTSAFAGGASETLATATATAKPASFLNLM
jgi:hypothetical protein